MVLHLGQAPFRKWNFNVASWSCHWGTPSAWPDTRECLSNEVPSIGTCPAATAATYTLCCRGQPCCKPLLSKSCRSHHNVKTHYFRPYNYLVERALAFKMALTTSVRRPKFRSGSPSWDPYLGSRVPYWAEAKKVTPDCNLPRRAFQERC